MTAQRDPIPVSPHTYIRGMRPGWPATPIRDVEIRIVSDNGRTPSSNPEDATLVHQVSNGDVAAFTMLYDRYVASVYTMAVHVLGASDADEIVQEVFLRLWLKADQYDASRGSFKSWFMTIARHRMLRELGSRSRHRRAQIAGDIDQVLSRVADSTVNVEECAWLHDRAHTLSTELGALPVEQRQVLLLAYFGGLSQSAIARHLDLPLGTVKKRTSLGMQKLRRALAPDRDSNPHTGEIESGESTSSLSKARINDGL